MVSDLTKKSTLVWGGGSCLKLMVPYLSSIGRSVDYLFSDTSASVSNVENLFASERPDIAKAAEKCDAFAICIGGAHGKRRFDLGQLFEFHYGLKPLSLIHPTSYICPTAVVGRHAFIMPGVIVHSYAQIGDYCILNTASVVEHECSLGSGVHIMGSAVLTGRVLVENFVTVGTNATILPDLSIGEKAFIGAGAVVTKNIHSNEVVAGVPARKLGV